MVGLRVKVLGRMGWTTSPHPRAGALSCPSPAILRAGLLRGPGLYTALWVALLLVPHLRSAALRLRGLGGGATMTIPGGAGTP
jgi:hypothetical protein